MYRGWRIMVFQFGMNIEYNTYMLKYCFMNENMTEKNVQYLFSVHSITTAIAKVLLYIVDVI